MRKILVPALAVLAFWAATGFAAAEAYVDAVPVPATAPKPQASVLYYRDGRTILARVGTTDHNDVPLSAVPVEVRNAVLTAEDRDFYEHSGVSARGVARAMVADAKGGTRQGASTITQQYARNAFLTQDVTVDRKMREMALAITLERQLSKDEILERYLNTIYYGRGAYGIAAAANAYFGVTTQQLTFAQGAVLAAVIKDPWGFDPAVNAKAARQRWNWIVAAARAAGWVVGGQVPYPAAAPTRSVVAGPNGLVVDRVEAELARAGITPRELHTGGLSVVTTLDATAQRAAVTTMRDQLGRQPAGLESALVAVDPANGGVRAYYGGARGSGYFDYAATTHPAASTFKPIVLAEALRRDIGFSSRWDGSSPRLFPGRLGVPLKNHGGLQCADCTLEEAMVESLNTPFYAVTEQVGAEQVRSMAVRLGISDTYGGKRSMVDRPGEAKPGQTRADIAIGRYPVTPGDLASVYATFAGGGERHERHFVQSVLGYTEPTAGKRVLDSGMAADISTVLQSVVRGDRVGPGRPAAGKTGTQQWGNTKDNQDAWMAGYTPELATAVWIGKAVPGPLRDAKGKAIEGETLPAQIWRDFTGTALAGSPATPFPKPAHVGRTDVGDAGLARKLAAQAKAKAEAKNPDKVPNPQAAASGYEPVVHTEHTGKRLALTFDDGPSADTPAVLDLLAQYDIKATFCVVGENVTWYPALVRRIVAEGHRLCNHSMHHDDLGTVPATTSSADIVATDQAIEAAAPGAEVRYYRAPYGDFGPSAEAGAKLGHTPLGWVVDPDDWLLPGAGVIASRITEQLKPRAVVLVHDGGGDRKQTVAALRTLIPQLLADGWKFDQPQTTVKALPPVSPSPSPSLSSSPSPSPDISDTPSEGIPSESASAGR
ncbi:MAG: transglycosylase domain-containing protein [Actinoplanes sp.]